MNRGRARLAPIDLAYNPAEKRDQIGRWTGTMSVAALLPLRMKSEGFDEEQVQKYEQAIRAGKFPGKVQVEDTPRDPLITDGHHRLEAARRLGLKKVPVVRFANTPAASLAALKRLNKIEAEKAIDLANPTRRERPQKKHTVPVPVDSDVTVRHIAEVLLASARFKRLHGDFNQELDAIAHLLAPHNIGTRAIRMALGLAHKEGGGRRGTAHAPNARLAEHGVELTDKIRQVRDHEVYFRAAYIANAASRLQRDMKAGLSPVEALRREAPHYKAHEIARKGRLNAVAQVTRAAELFGVPADHGTLVGWYINPLLNNEVECLTANGCNFYAEEGTVIGLPGSVHPRCGCYAGAPHEGAALVNDRLHNVVKLQRSAKPKFKLKGRAS